MSSSKYRRMLVLSLVLSAGALALPPAEAAPGRSSHPNAGSAVQKDLFTRSLIETVKNLWGLLKDAPPRPPHGNGNGSSGPPYYNGDEGPSVCPHGGHPHP
jgi:hypothetical protein